MGFGKNQADYSRAEAKQLGTLHERMQYVMEALHALADALPEEIRATAPVTRLWHGVYDLRTEVSLHDSGPSRGQMVRLLKGQKDKQLGQMEGSP